MARPRLNDREMVFRVADCPLIEQLKKWFIPDAEWKIFDQP